MDKVCPRKGKWHVPSSAHEVGQGIAASPQTLLAEKCSLLGSVGPGRRRCPITDVCGCTLKKKKGPAIFEDIFFCYYLKIYAQDHSKKCVSIGIKKLDFQNAFLQAYVSPVAESVTCLGNVQETAEKECHLLEVWLAVTCFIPYFIVTI